MKPYTQRYELVGSKQIGLKQFEDAKRNFDKAIEIKSLLGLDSLKVAKITKPSAILLIKQVSMIR